MKPAPKPVLYSTGHKGTNSIEILNKIQRFPLRKNNIKNVWKGSRFCFALNVLNTYDGALLSDLIRSSLISINFKKILITQTLFIIKGHFVNVTSLRSVYVFIFEGQQSFKSITKLLSWGYMTDLLSHLLLSVTLSVSWYCRPPVAYNIHISQVCNTSKIRKGFNEYIWYLCKIKDICRN